MFPIDPSLFYKPMLYYGSEDIDEEFEVEEEELDPPLHEIVLSNPAQTSTGMYLHLFDL